MRYLLAVGSFAVVSEGTDIASLPVGWPGATAEASNALWSQPEKFAEWPTNDADDLPQACRTVHPQTLKSHLNDGWPGQCNELVKEPAATTADLCRQHCANRGACSTWQFNEDSTNGRTEADQGCWLGQGIDCWGRGGSDSLEIIDAERMQQGTVTVLDSNFNDMWLEGVDLRESGAGAMQAAQDNELDLIDRCRKQCYSDIYCRAWQYHIQVGCVRESQSHQLSTPLTTLNYVSAASLNRNFNPTEGEFIKHVCPPGDAVVQTPSESWSTMTIVLSILGAVAGLAILYGLIHYFMQAKKPKAGKRALKAVAKAPKEEVTPLVQPHVPSLLPLVQPQMQYVSLPQQHYVTEYAPVQQAPSVTYVQPAQQMYAMPGAHIVQSYP